MDLIDEVLDYFQDFTDPASRRRDAQKRMIAAVAVVAVTGAMLKWW